MLKPFDKHVADCLLNFFIRTACPLSEATQQQQQQPQQQQQHNLNQNEAFSKKCLFLFEIAISNNIWPNAEIKFDYLDKLLVTLEGAASLSSLAGGTGTASVNQIINNVAVQQPGQQQSTTQPPLQAPNYTSICTCIEVVTYLVESQADSRPKIQNILRILNRGLTACLMSTNSRVVKAMSSLVQKLISIIPIECFNTNPTVNAPSPLIDGMNLNETAFIQPQQQQPPSDPIYSLFGQPDGVLCKAILDGLSYYDKYASNNPGNFSADSNSTSSTFNSSNLNSSIEVLTNSLVLLKAASTNNPQYIDRIMGPFMKILQRLYRDHLNSTGALSSAPTSQVPATSTSPENSNFMLGPNSSSVCSFSELLIQFLDLIKYRIGVMSIEMRKMFVNSILVTLIEKSVDLRLIRYLSRLVSEWIKYKNGPLLNQIPSMKEKLVLLQRLTAAMEKRFAEHADLQQLFLETIAYVYRDELYAATGEFKIKLEQAFLAGLKSSNPQIRRQFFDIFNTNFNSNDLYERLCYIIVTQNWEAFGAHYWIKQCIQMTLGACATANAEVQYSDLTAARFKFNGLLSATPSFGDSEPITTDPTVVMSWDTELNNEQVKGSNNKPLATTNDEQLEAFLLTNKKAMTMFEPSIEETSMEQKMDTGEPIVRHAKTREQLLSVIVENQFNLFEFCKEVKCGDLIVSLCQLCHLNGELAHQIWIQLFIQMFNLLNPKQQQNLYGELTPFVASGSHCVQKQSSLSTLNTFIESFAMAKPVSLFLRPSLLAYLAKNHNLWHRTILLLENSLFTSAELTQPGAADPSVGVYDSASSQPNATTNQQQQSALQNVQHETFSSLSQLYAQLKEDDYRVGLWHK